MSSPSRRYFAVSLFLGILCLCYILISYDLEPGKMGSKALDSIALSFNLQKPFYLVVIDAGSTGSRALAFKFHESIVSGDLVLDDELFTEIKPGLSSYGADAVASAQSLVVLLDRVKSVIPREFWAKTHLTLRATAGLRLLPGHQSEKILAECHKLLLNSGFKLTHDSIAIMNGSDEGIFSWFTVNFLLERFSNYAPTTTTGAIDDNKNSNTVAALDLGGGSTQVTFAVAGKGDSFFSVNILNRNMSVYTHSYLGMGLMAARKAILIPPAAIGGRHDRNARSAVGEKNIEGGVQQRDNSDSDSNKDTNINSINGFSNFNTSDTIRGGDNLADDVKHTNDKSNSNNNDNIDDSNNKVYTNNNNNNNSNNHNHNQRHARKPRSTSTNGSQQEPIIIHSECINPIVSTEWTYGGITYLVKGPVNGAHRLVKSQNFAGGEENRPVVNFKQCLKIIEKYVDSIGERPVGLKKHEIYAFSYYFERATEVGLVDPFFGGVVQVGSFLKQAMEACDYPNIEQPFICLDLTFIYVLLRDGFGLDPATKLYLYKKINGHELSWGLGAAFNALQNGL